MLHNLEVRRTCVIERRRLPRTKVAQPAKVLAENADVGHDCTVENLNTLGACISFDATTFAELPHKFDLTFFPLMPWASARCCSMSSGSCSSRRVSSNRALLSDEPSPFVDIEFH